MRRNSRSKLAVAFALGLLLVACQGSDFELGSSEPPPEGWVEIKGKRIAVEIAESPAKQALGLGQRDSLDWDTGMYFLYERPAFYSFWMKGMRFSIDIIWIHKGRIVDLDTNVPFEKGGNGPTVRPRSLVDAVLEVPAGYSAASGWTLGDRVSFERTPVEAR
ncbi:MAG: DUF192 domain-containing protein [Myxococcota bacterium]